MTIRFGSIWVVTSPALGYNGPASAQGIMGLGNDHGARPSELRSEPSVLPMEEMFGIADPRGAIFHAASKRRHEVMFTANLRARTEAAVAGRRALLGAAGFTTRDSEVTDTKYEAPPLPPAVRKPACEECSLFDPCLPDLTQGGATLRRAARSLFQI